MTVSDAARARACRVLGHDDPADLNLPACPISDDDLVEQLVARVERQAARIADDEARRLDEWADGLGNR